LALDVGGGWCNHRISSGSYEGKRVDAGKHGDEKIREHGGYAVGKWSDSHTQSFIPKVGKTAKFINLTLAVKDLCALYGSCQTGHYTGLGSIIE
jgi:hypothetical protein